jgi:hypothetical protein
MIHEEKLLVTLSLSDKVLLKFVVNNHVYISDKSTGLPCIRMLKMKGEKLCVYRNPKLQTGKYLFYSCLFNEGLKNITHYFLYFIPFHAYEHRTQFYTPWEKYH